MVAPDLAAQKGRAVRAAPSFSLPELLRRWRLSRGMSQEELALAADTTCRYVSFIENGRATPSRAMLERLATALDMDALQYNTVCEAAGYLPVLASDSTPDPNVASLVRPALEQHMPNPAFAMQPDWTLLSANAAAEQLLRLGHHPGPNAALAGLNALELTMRPDGLRPLIHNWTAWAWCALQHLHKLARRLDAPPPILDTLRAHPDVAELEARIEPPDPDGDIGTLVLDHGGAHWPYLQLHSRIATADHDIGASTRVVLLFPQWSTNAAPAVPGD